MRGPWTLGPCFILTCKVSAYTRKACKLGDDNREGLLTYISVLYKVYEFCILLSVSYVMLSVNSLPNVLTFSCSEVGSNCISPDSFMVHVTAQTRHFIGNPASTIAIQAAFIAQESNLTIKESQHVYFQSVKTKTY